MTVLLTSEPLSLDAAFRAVLDPACGGTALFVGTTRSPNQGHQVDELEYEAYTELAEPEMERVGDFIAEVLRAPEDAGVHEAVRGKVRELCERFPLYDPLS